MESEERINQRVGRAIAKKRKAAGFTQDEVSEHLAIGREAFSRIERGVTGASVAKLYMLASLFGCGVEAFLIEGTRYSSDQALDRMLAGLPSTDREFILQLADKLAQKLKSKSDPASYHNEG